MVQVSLLQSCMTCPTVWNTYSKHLHSLEVNTLSCQRAQLAVCSANAAPASVSPLCEYFHNCCCRLLCFDQICGSITTSIHLWTLTLIPQTSLTSSTGLLVSAAGEVRVNTEFKGLIQRMVAECQVSFPGQQIFPLVGSQNKPPTQSVSI